MLTLHGVSHCEANRVRLSIDAGLFHSEANRVRALGYLTVKLTGLG